MGAEKTSSSRITLAVGITAVALFLLTLKLAIVGEKEVSLLRQLENSQMWPYTFKSEAEKEDMRNQLRRLRTLGLISPKRSVSHIIDDKNNGRDIKADITVTNQGKEFLNFE